MTYYFVHYFEGIGCMPDERKIEIAKRKAVEQLAKKLLEDAVFEVDEHGNVRGEVVI